MEWGIINDNFIDTISMSKITNLTANLEFINANDWVVTNRILDN